MSYGPDQWKLSRDERDYPARPWTYERSDEGNVTGYRVQNELKTLWVGDLHINASPPGWRTDTYEQDMLAKVEWLMAEAEKHQVDLILWAGDIFHSKKNVPWGLLADFHDRLITANCEQWILPGNHDLINNNLLDVRRRPIGLLARTAGIELALEPFLRSPCWFTPIPYFHEINYDAIRAAQRPKPEYWSVLLAHVGVTENLMPFPTHLTDHPEWNPGADVIFTGHIHDDLGVWKDRHGALVFNTGSVSRGSLTEENLERTPRVLYTEWALKPVEPKFKAWSIPVRPAADVFRLTDATEKKEGERVAEQFLAELGATVVRTISLEDLKSQIVTMDLPDKVKAYATEAIEETWETT